MYIMTKWLYLRIFEEIIIVHDAADYAGKLMSSEADNDKVYFKLSRFWKYFLGLL